MRQGTTSSKYISSTNKYVILKTNTMICIVLCIASELFAGPASEVSSSILCTNYDENEHQVVRFGALLLLCSSIHTVTWTDVVSLLSQTMTRRWAAAHRNVSKEMIFPLHSCQHGSQSIALITVSLLPYAYYSHKRIAVT